MSLTEDEFEENLALDISLQRLRFSLFCVAYSCWLDEHMVASAQKFAWKSCTSQQVVANSLVVGFEI